ncbi:sigma-70 family RNA polymerase sigma factor [Mesorhizobium sp. ES1-4]|uniref:sigma-70 family RNA polymerase sigma factor n=1 Tax=Mesorhizobium sp. ES1-4 TaxID=2876627 RepID=UPI001CCADEF7|nr:sigma-70 family RNA polymerase sigma factor [Mesorhizobium sp. ES1-4]MBZ9796577.1 RNA polymerase sigma factor [Mesorhizobium sp. ES1-4]
MTGQHELEKLLSTMRPRLHRYCARMVGSTIDAEDIVQGAYLKAVTAWGGEILAIPEGWLFRIAHNTAHDFLRHRRRAPTFENLEDVEMTATFPSPDPQVAAASIQTFMRLPPLQRSVVVMKDALGHSLEEIAEVNGVSAPVAKSALQRARAALRAFVEEPEDIELPTLPDEMKKRLAAYVDGFRNGGFDAVRATLAEDVRLDLVSKLTRDGKLKSANITAATRRANNGHLKPGWSKGAPQCWSTIAKYRSTNQPTLSRCRSAVERSCRSTTSCSRVMRSKACGCGDCGTREKRPPWRERRK